MTVRRLLTDNGSAFRSRDFKKACDELGIVHRFTRPYRPHTNGKAERFIQSVLREWAYGSRYQHSTERTAALDAWIGRTTRKIFKPMRDGDVKDTYGDNGRLQAAVGFAPSTPLEEGLPRFARWFRTCYKV